MLINRMRKVFNGEVKLNNLENPFYLLILASSIIFYAPFYFLKVFSNPEALVIHNEIVLHGVPATYKILFFCIALFLLGVLRLYFFEQKTNFRQFFQAKSLLLFNALIFIALILEKNYFTINLLTCAVIYSLLKISNIQICKNKRATNQLENIILVIFFVLLLSSVIEIHFSPKNIYLSNYYNILRASTFFLNANLFAAFISLLYFSIRLISKNDSKIFSLTCLYMLNILASGSRSIFIIYILFELMSLLFFRAKIRNLFVSIITVYLLSITNANNWVINNFKNESIRFIDSFSTIYNYSQNQNDNKIIYIPSKDKSLESNNYSFPEIVDKNIPISGRINFNNSLSDNTLIALYSDEEGRLTFYLYVFIFFLIFTKIIRNKYHKVEHILFFTMSCAIFSVIRIHVFPLNLFFTTCIFYLFNDTKRNNLNE